VDCLYTDASQAVVLRLQHDPSVSAHHARSAAWLLHPKRLRREGLYGQVQWRHCCHGDKVSMGITTLLSMTVFLMLVTESMPPTSDVLPLVGQYAASTLPRVSWKRSYAELRPNSTSFDLLWICLLYNMLYNKSTTNRHSTANPQQVVHKSTLTVTVRKAQTQALFKKLFKNI